MPRSKDRGALVVLLAIALAVRLPGLLESIWYDELWSTRVVIGGLGDLIREARYDVHPPMYNVLAYIWRRIAGDSELSIRMIPLGAGLATIGLMPRLGALFASRAAGRVAAAFLAISPVHIWYSQEARAYSLLMLLAVALPLIWNTLGGDHGWSWRSAAYLALAAVVSLMHYYAVVVLGVILLIALAQRRGRVTAALGLGFGIVLVSSYLIIRARYGTVVTSVPYLDAFTGPQAAGLFTSWYPLGGTVAWLGPEAASFWLRALATLFVVFMLGLVGLWLFRPPRSLPNDDRPALLGFTFGIPIGLLGVGLFGATDYYVPRSTLPGFPYFALMVGAAAVGIRRVVARRWTHAALGIGAALALILYWQRSNEWTVYKPNPDWRSTARAIRSASPDPRPVVISATSLRELLYYDRGSATCEWPLRNSEGEHRPLGRFPQTVQPTCGPSGQARFRLYRVRTMSIEETLSILDHEQQDELFLVHDRFAGGRRDSLPATLGRAPMLRAEPVAELKGIVVTRFVRARRLTLEDLEEPQVVGVGPGHVYLPRPEADDRALGPKFDPHR